MGERRSLCRVLIGKPEIKRPLGRPRRRWGDYYEGWNFNSGNYLFTTDTK